MNGELELTKFSERIGITSQKLVQLEDVDDELSNRLWNAIRDHWIYLSDSHQYGLYMLAWDTYFKRPADEIEGFDDGRYADIHRYYFGCSWSEVYDFVEFTCRFFMTLPSEYGVRFADHSVKRLVGEVNGVLESERSGYRFVGKNIVEISSHEEIAAVESALESPDTVSAHIQASLGLFSNRESPSYRSAISEAICAVEAVCRLITGDNKATLGKALKELEKHNAIDDHPALNEAFRKIYGYTSDAQGIRHAMTELPSVSVEDAQFMIVACSTFVNYLKAKAAKASIPLEEEPVNVVHSPN